MCVGMLYMPVQKKFFNDHHISAGTDSTRYGMGVAPYTTRMYVSIQSGPCPVNSNCNCTGHWELVPTHNLTTSVSILLLPAEGEDIMLLLYTVFTAVSSSFSPLLSLSLSLSLFSYVPLSHK